METPQPEPPSSNYAPLIIGTILLFLLATATVSHYGNVRTQPWYVSVACIIGWCFPFWIVLLLPVDYASTLYDHCDGQCRVPYFHVSESFLYIAWRTLYWTSFCLTWVVIPMTQAYVNTGDFGVTRRIKSAFQVNLRFYSIYVVVGIVGLIYLVIGNGYTTRQKIQSFTMALANSWGLFLVIMFMGYGLVSVPRSLWFSGNVNGRLKRLYATASRAKEECIDSELEFTELAKTMNAVYQRVPRNDPFLRSLVDQMTQRFPFILDQDYNDRDNTVRIPRTITEEYLVKLNKDMVLAVRMKNRKLALWKNLLYEAFRLQDIITNRDNPSHRFKSTLRRAKEDARWQDTKEWLEWWWRLRIEPMMHRFLAIVFACLSVCILWSELVFNVQSPLLSVVAIGLRACGFNYAAVEITVFLTLMYMCLCVYTSLFKVRFFNLYLLVPHHHTDENSLLWFTGYLCKMMAPLCYNFLNLAGNFSGTSANDSVFSEFMGRANLVPFLGESFTDWFPVVILIPAFAVLLNIQERCLGLCGIKNVYDKDDDDPEAASINVEIADGRSLVEEERAYRERELNPSIRAQGGVVNRARSALEAYTSKYKRPGTPSSAVSSLHSTSSRPSPLVHSIRQERDRRIDEILSGRRTPPVFEGGEAQHYQEIHEPQPATNPALALGGVVKKKLSQLFSVNKTQPIYLSPDVQPLESHAIHSSNRSGRRVFGQAPSSSRPNSIGGVDARSRSPSPTMYTSRVRGPANSREHSPFARLDESDESV